MQTTLEEGITPIRKSIKLPRPGVTVLMHAAFAVKVCACSGARVGSTMIPREVPAYSVYTLYCGIPQDNLFAHAAQAGSPVLTCES
jgi:hypothetical protein